MTEPRTADGIDASRRVAWARFYEASTKVDELEDRLVEQWKQRLITARRTLVSTRLTDDHALVKGAWRTIRQAHEDHYGFRAIMRLQKEGTNVPTPAPDREVTRGDPIRSSGRRSAR